MRKGLISLLVVATLIFGVAAGVGAESIRRSITVEYPGIRLTVDGKVVDTTGSQPFIVVDQGRTYVPARYVAEALGARVNWEADTNTVAMITPSYLVRSDEGDLTTFNLPYYGVSFKAPTKWGAVPSRYDTLALRGTDGWMVINEVDKESFTAFDTLANMELRNMVFANNLTVTGSVDVTIQGAVNARDYTGTIKPGGLDQPALIRMIATDHNFWSLAIFYNPAQDPDGKKAASYLQSFTLGH